MTATVRGRIWALLWIAAITLVVLRLRDSNTLELNIQDERTARIEIFVEEDSRSPGTEAQCVRVETEGADGHYSLSPVSRGLFRIELPGRGRYRLQVVAGMRSEHPDWWRDDEFPIKCEYVVASSDWIKTEPGMVQVRTLQLPPTVPVDIRAFSIDQFGRRTERSDDSDFFVRRVNESPRVPLLSESQPDSSKMDGVSAWGNDSSKMDDVCAWGNIMTRKTYRIYLLPGHYQYGNELSDMTKYKTAELVLGKPTAFEFEVRED